MPTLQDVAPSEWIKANQFKPNEQKTLTIKGWETSLFKDQKSGREKKSITLLFHETQSKLGIVNVANENALNKIFGNQFDLDSLAGKQITLFTILVKQDDTGEPIYGIRIKAANGYGNSALPVPHAAPNSNMLYWKNQHGQLIKDALTQIAPFRGKSDLFIAETLAAWEAQGVIKREDADVRIFDLLNQSASAQADAKAAQK